MLEEPVEPDFPGAGPRAAAPESAAGKGGKGHQWGAEVRNTPLHAQDSIRRAWARARFAVPVLLAAMAAAVLAGCPQGDSARVGSATCLVCHDGIGASNVSEFLDSVHFALGIECEDCHGPGLLHVRNGGRLGLFIENPGDKGFAAVSEACGACHGTLVAEFQQSKHFQTETVNCTACHDIHGPNTLAAPVENNELCLNCHASQFPTPDVLEKHIGPFHDADVEGNALGRCVKCHMIPVTFADQDMLNHGFNPVDPAVTVAAIQNGEDPLPPNTCAGVAGCHDPNVAGSGFPRELNDFELQNALANAFNVVGQLDK